MTDGDVITVDFPAARRRRDEAAEFLAWEKLMSEMTPLWAYKSVDLIKIVRLAIRVPGIFA